MDISIAPNVTLSEYNGEHQLRLLVNGEWVVAAIIDDETFGVLAAKFGVCRHRNRMWTTGEISKDEGEALRLRRSTRGILGFYCSDCKSYIFPQQNPV